MQLVMWAQQALPLNEKEDVWVAAALYLQVMQHGFIIRKKHYSPSLQLVVCVIIPIRT